jgi:small subunit ribosomal protein S16
MLTLRLARAGTKKRPVYHLVAADSRSRRDGRFIENLGYYNPVKNVLVLKHDRVEYWMGVGATTSETASQLIKKAKRHGNTQPVAKPKYQAPPPAPKAAEPPKAEPKASENAVEKTE